MSNIESPPSISDPLSALTADQKLAGVYVLRRPAVSAGAEAPIWLAHDEVLGKDVTLHFLPAAVRSDSRAMTELRQEIKRNRQLIHPNILRVYDLIEEADWAAISMDAFEGESVATLQKQKDGNFFEPGDLRPWLQQLCPALDDVHKIQMVHRNVSPPNLFIDKAGKLLIANFGISRVVEDALGRAQKPAGEVERHVVYMSPQQMDGESPVKGDDLYALGVTLYELLAGQPPFVDGDIVPQIRKTVPESMMERRVKLGRRGGTILPAWEKAVAACLAKNPAERPQSAGELAGKLGLGGKNAVSESVVPGTPIALAAAVALAKNDKSEPAKKSEGTGKTEGANKSAKDKESIIRVERTRPNTIKEAAKTKETPKEAPAAAPAAYTDIAAAVAADEREASLREHGETEGKAGGKKSAPSAYPSPYPPRSKTPTVLLGLAAAAAVVLACVWFFEKPPSDEQPPKNLAGQGVDNSADLAQTKNGADAPADGRPSATPDREVAAANRNPQPDATANSNGAPTDAPNGAPGAVVAKAGDASGNGLTTPAPGSVSAPDPAAAKVGESSAPGAIAAPSVQPPGRQVSSGDTHGAPAVTAPPAPAPAAEAPSIGLGGPLLAENNSSKGSGRSGKGTGHAAVPATPAPAASAPVSAGDTAPLPSGGDLSPEKLRLAADTADKKAKETHKLQEQAEAAVAVAQKSLDAKAKALAPIMESAKDLQAQREQREEQVKAADLAAQQARQVADEKTHQADDSKKALSTWDTQNKAKLAAHDKADAELKALQKTLEDKQHAAAEAAKAATVADEATKQELAMLQKAEEASKAREEQQKKDADRLKKKQQLDEQMQSVEQMRKELEEKMDKLKELQKSLEQPAAPGGSGAAPAAPAPVRSERNDDKSSPVAIASGPAANGKPAAPPAPPPPSPVMPKPGPAAHSGPPIVAANDPSAAGNDTSAGSKGGALEPDALLAMAKVTPPTPSPIVPPQTEPEAGHPAGGAPGGFENSLGQKFVPVGDVLFCVWPTRVKDFETFAKEVNVRGNWRNPGFKQGPDHPVVDVTWTEAMAFCKWLTERDRKKGVLTAAQYYRLPTDLEWSKGVGLPEEAGKTPEARDMGIPDVFPWGTQWPPPPNVGNYTGEETGSDVAIKGYDDGFAWTSPVGSFPANKYGLYDMGGNVWQWCMDSWNSDSKAKVLRGASWYNGGLKLSLLSSCRVNENPDSSTDNYGFRIVRATEGGRAKS